MTVTRIALRAFLDCNTFCDTEFIKREITYVNWVRGRADADEHLIVTSQSTGGGGQEFTLRYLGLRAFRGSDDELKFTTAAPADLPCRDLPR
jgi:hypothetical protein